MLPRYFWDFSESVGAFVIGPSQISSFFSLGTGERCSIDKK